VVRCVAYDHRGWGRSGAPAAGYAVADLASDAMALISALGIEDYVLVGHSMGGKVAQALAAAHPKGQRGLVLVAPAPASPKVLSGEVRAQMLSAYRTRDTVLATLDNMLSHVPLEDDLREQIVQGARCSFGSDSRLSSAIAGRTEA